MKTFTIIIALILICDLGFSQIAAPAIQGQKALGGSGADMINSIEQLMDGGYIIAGSSNSTNGDIKGHHNSGGGEGDEPNDCWVSRFNNSGGILWSKVYGGRSDDDAKCIQQTSDGGYILAGSTYSNDGDIKGNHLNKYGNATKDALIIKLSNNGIIEWQKSLGGSGEDEANYIQQTSDGGYILAGATNSNNGNVKGLHGNTDCWIVKLSKLGNIVWQKTLGGSNFDYASSIKQTLDSGYIIGGTTSSKDGNVNGNHGGQDIWIIKISKIGIIQWQKTMGGSNDDWAEDIQLTQDGGYVIAGATKSEDGDVTGFHKGTNQFGQKTNDFWVIKLKETGEIEWNKAYGGAGFDIAKNIIVTKDGGYIVCGVSDSNDGNVENSYGSEDGWILKLNIGGQIQWQKVIGGSGTDIAQKIIQTRDGGYMIAGNTTSNDVKGYHTSASFGAFDGWIVKLKSDNLVNNMKNDNSTIGLNQAIRLENESAEEFVKRAFNVKEFISPFIEANMWYIEKKDIAYFENFRNNGYIIGYLLLPISEKKYQRVLIDTFSTNDVGCFFSEINHVFTATVKNDFLPELIITTKWNAHSPRFAEEFDEGYYYNVNIYKHPNMDNPEKRLKRNEKLGYKLCGFEGFTYNRKTNKKTIKTDKFKEIAAIRLALSQMNF